MNWYIGQDIVCVDDKGAELSHSKIHSGLKEGAVYNIVGVMKGCCDIVIDVGIKRITDKNTCRCTCGKSFASGDKWYFKESRFAPLDTLADISELTEVLKTTKPFEV